ncbi:HAMP domain-containing sensor histidine kinase [Hymenobacter psychrotolerans]|uniref:histidine kinase n=1 Tax=Hymenobacter psychrotolerans DSM 18569 TaxID=1121959 RepID=A0A1M7F7K4_9BACT|nr:ATP-binding protein [Hymenobacter psychrotolerans]SHL99953.1 PAS domain S-box-containing protein [Hymenobacter psychrotolerans DSM 18569]
MNLKTKITLGFLAMLLLLLSIGGYGYYSLHQLDRNSRNVLTANLYSVNLGQQMLRALDQLGRQPLSDTAGTARFVAALDQEARNITEPGEQRLVDEMNRRIRQLQRQQQDALRAGSGPAAASPEPAALRRLTYQMIELNTRALNQKTEAANRRADQANRNLLTFLTLATLLALGLVASVPEAAVQPLRKLTAALRHATERDFSATIPQESHDEFGQVARAFNQMLSQLREYRSSTAAELITARNRAASIVNTLDEGLLLLDEHRRILLANPVMCELLGLPAEKLVGQPAPLVRLHNDLLQALLTPLDAPNRAAAVAEAPLLRISQRGEEAFYRLAVQDLVSFNEATEKTEFVGQILTLRNVSDFKKLDQVKSNFLATVSHELKTPLSSMNINLKLLQDERLPADERLRITGQVRQETQRLQRMVAELLDVSRLDAGAGIQLDLRPTNLADVVQYATATVQAQLTDKHLRLDLLLPTNLPAARADVEKTTWVLINLLANAIRYSPVGEALTVRAAPAGAFVQVSVQDHGPGIAADHHDRIFQRFAQIPDKTGYRGGSGLGLSIAREFITTQGGRLWVESEPGSGSTFHFTLPTV